MTGTAVISGRDARMGRGHQLDPFCPGWTQPIRFRHCSRTAAGAAPDCSAGYKTAVLG